MSTAATRRGIIPPVSLILIVLIFSIFSSFHSKASGPTAVCYTPLYITVEGLNDNPERIEEEEEREKQDDQREKQEKKRTDDTEKQKSTDDRIGESSDGGNSYKNGDERRQSRTILRSTSPNTGDDILSDNLFVSLNLIFLFSLGCIVLMKKKNI